MVVTTQGQASTTERLDLLAGLVERTKMATAYATADRLPTVLWDFGEVD